jgi:two-component system cell cycle response regulator
LILVDLDHFKKINDTHGHPAGDFVLKETCRILVESVFRVEDVLGRYGGEEFMVLLPDCDFEVASDVAERARKTLENHKFIFEGKTIPVSASFGVTGWKPTYKKADDLVAFVDTLLYEAKRAGRNRVVSKN